MDQIKIGRFISACRKEKGLTQAQLGERLGITDRAISKWETGKSMPDSSIMLELCGLLGISVNELLTGERIQMTDYSKKAEENLIELKRYEEQARLLLQLEWVIGYICTATFLILIFIASYLIKETLWQAILIAVAIVIFGIGIWYAMKLERNVGFYACARCGHKYIPSMNMFWWSMHFGRTRYMKCPKCGKWSWQKKVLTDK